MDEVIDVVSDFDATENRDARILVNPNPILSVDAGNAVPGIADMDRTDGILRGQFDFTGYFMTAIANAIGFDTGVIAVNAALQDPNLPRDISITPLDLFRFEPGDGGADFRNSPRALDPALPAHVFYDGGRFDPEGLPIAGLQLGDVPLSRTSSPASWEDPANINNVYLGIAQPVFPASFEFYITEADRSASGRDRL